MADEPNVTVRVGDLFESDAQTLVNTVNCVGVMGKGVALEFKKRFPEMFEDYVARCRRGNVQLGKPYLFRYLTGPWILNFPTKDHWRSVAQLDDIVRGLEHLEAHYREWGITSLAVPPLGCGQGQLEWRVVGPTLYRMLNRLDVPVDLFAPFDASESELHPAYLGTDDLANQVPSSLVRPAWVALAEIVRRIDDQPYHPPIGRVKFQKLAYMATREGLPTGLEFRASSFGPFARDLKSTTTKMANNGLITEQRAGRMFRVRPGNTLDDARSYFSHELAEWEPVIERTTDLFMRLDYAQTELVATVIFARDSLVDELRRIPTESEVLQSVLEWKNKRDQRMNPNDVASAVRNLAALGWLEVIASPELAIDDLFDVELVAESSEV